MHFYWATTAAASLVQQAKREVSHIACWLDVSFIPLSSKQRNAWPWSPSQYLAHLSVESSNLELAYPFRALLKGWHNGSTEVPHLTRFNDNSRLHCFRVSLCFKVREINCINMFLLFFLYIFHIFIYIYMYYY